MPSRRSKVTSAELALAGLEDGTTIGLGGWTFYNTPMMLLRELVRVGIRGVHLVASPGAIGPDLLVATGVVSILSTPFLTMEQFGLAPGFRRRAEEGSLEVREIDGPALASGLRAAATSMPYGLIHDIGTDLPSVNPTTYQPVSDRGDDAALFRVPALKPDVVFLHAQRADEYGNLQFFGATFFDQLLARAGRHVIATVDEIVDPHVIRSAPELTKVPGYLVTSLVPGTRSAWPCGSHGRYEPDLDHLRRYAELAASGEGLEQYVDQYVYDAGDTEVLR